MQMTMYPTKTENEEKTKIKANFSLETKDFTLTGFKLYESTNPKNNEKELKLMIPSEMVKEENGEPKMKDGKIINKHPVSINDRLTNRQEVFNNLQTEAVKFYNEFKANPKLLEEGQSFIQKNVEMPNAEQGELNVKNVWLTNPQKNTNPGYQLKANATILTGAFQINKIPLIYDVKKNEYNIILPKQEYTNKNGEIISKGYAIPKNAKVFADVKNMIVKTVEGKIKENRQEYIKAKEAEKLAQAQKQGATQTQTEAPKAPVLK